jgi:rhamnosyltransferase subunit B
MTPPPTTARAPRHILISCVGSAGDVYPFLAIGRALQRRGHRVEVLTTPYFRERIEAAGLAFVPVGDADDFQRIVADPDLWHPRRAFATIWTYLQRSLREGYEQIAARATPGTVLVGGVLAWHNRFAQEKLGLSGATVHLSRYGLFSAVDPVAVPGFTWLRHLPPSWVRRIQVALERWQIEPVVTPALDAIRGDLGLPPVRGLFTDWINSPQRIICAFPEWFSGAPADWPSQTVITDFPRWDAVHGEALEPDLARFLEQGPAPVGVTPGSAMAHGHTMIARALGACAALGRRAVVVTPYRDQLPAPLPRSACHVAYAPFDLLLPRLAGLVHHGGIGTAAQALAAGVPQLVAPHAHDQFDNAAQLTRLGLGAAVPPAAGVRRWSRELDRLLRDEGVAKACQLAAQRCRELVPGEAKIADMVEAL